MNKNILVTGGCGFIFSNVINHIFYSFNGNLINIDAMFYCASEKNIDEKIRDDKRYKFIKGDICDFNLIAFILKEYKIEIVIHAGALTHVDHSFNQSLEYTRNNVLGTHTLLEACRQYGKIEKFINISTDEVYGSSNHSDINSKDESSLLYPTNPYAASKACAEMICHSYIESFNMPIITTRSNNIFGPNQYPDKVIPKFIQLLMENKKLTIHGNGCQIRGFLYTKDVCKAFETILNKGKIGEIYNISSPYEYSVIDIAKMLIEKVKNTKNYDEWITYVEDRPFNDQRYFINDSKLKDLGWKIEYSFEKALDETIEHYVSKFSL